MADGRNQDAFASNEVGHGVGKPRNVDATETAGPLTPQQRGSDNGGADKFDLGAES